MSDVQKSVILLNRDRFEAFQFTLYHHIVCEGGECHCVKVAAREADRRGEFDTVAKTVTILPRKYSEPLPRAVLKVPQVRVALTKDNPPRLVEANKLAEVQVFKPKPEPKRY